VVSDMDQAAQCPSRQYARGRRQRVASAIEVGMNVSIRALKRV
jgi:hypothetical protein